VYVSFVFILMETGEGKRAKREPARASSYFLPLLYHSTNSSMVTGHAPSGS
jgi:hypothetical protein